MVLIRSLVHLLVLVVTVIPYTLVILLLSVVGAPVSWRYGVARAWLKLTIDSARWILGIRTRVSGQEHLFSDPARGAVLLCKHQSAYETLLLPALLERPLAYVFKKELLRIPFFGWSLASLDMVHIDRGHPARAFVKMLQMGQQLLARGHWVVIFPEGTRVARGTQGKYMAGGAQLAIKAGVPVIPVAVTSARVWPPKAFIKQPGVVEVSFGAPIPTEGRKPDELMREVQQWIEGEMHRLDPDAYSAATPDAGKQP